MHGVVVLPVEGGRAPDLVQLVKVGVVEPGALHVDHVRVPAGQVKRNLARVIRPLVGSVVVQVRVDPHVEEDGRIGADDDTAASLRFLLLAYGTDVSAQFIERLRDQHVEIEIDASVLGEHLQAVDVRVRRVKLWRANVIAEQFRRWIALHHLEFGQLHDALPIFPDRRVVRVEQDHGRVDELVCTLHAQHVMKHERLRRVAEPYVMDNVRHLKVWRVFRLLV